MPRRPLSQRVPPSQLPDAVAREAALEAAIHAVQSDGVSQRKAAQEHGVSPSTLRHRMAGRRSRSEYAQDLQKLCAGFEDSLAEWVDDLASRYLPPPPRIIKEEALRLLRLQTGSDNVSLDDHWCQAFLRRHERLRRTMSNTGSNARLQACNKDTANAYFDRLEASLGAHGIHTDLLFNMDETGFTIGSKARQIVYTSAQNNPRGLHAVLKEMKHLTVVECVSRAYPEAIPPLFLIAGKNIIHGMMPRQPGPLYHARIRTGPSAWMNAEGCLDWLRHCFIPGANTLRQEGQWVGLLLDGLRAHWTADMLRLAQDNRVLLMGFPPNTTSELQPLDVGIFNHIKAAWDNAQTKLLRDGQERVAVGSFVELYGKIRLDAVDNRRCRQAFMLCGVGPSIDRAGVIARLPAAELSTPSPPPREAPRTPTTMASVQYALEALGATSDPRDKALWNRKLLKFAGHLLAQTSAERDDRRRRAEAAKYAREQLEGARRRVGPGGESQSIGELSNTMVRNERALQARSRASGRRYEPPERLRQSIADAEDAEDAIHAVLSNPPPPEPAPAPPEPFDLSDDDRHPEDPFQCSGSYE